MVDRVVVWCGIASAPADGPVGTTGTGMLGADDGLASSRRAAASMTHDTADPAGAAGPVPEIGVGTDATAASAGAARIGAGGSPGGMGVGSGASETGAISSGSGGGAAAVGGITAAAGTATADQRTPRSAAFADGTATRSEFPDCSGPVAAGFPSARGV